MIQLNTKSMRILFCTLSLKEFNEVFFCDNVKEIRDGSRSDIYKF